MRTVTIALSPFETCVQASADSLCAGTQFDNRATTLRFERPAALSTHTLLIALSTLTAKFAPIVVTDNQFELTNLFTQDERLRVQVILEKDAQQVRSNVLTFSLRPSVTVIRPPQLDVPDVGGGAIADTSNLVVKTYIADDGTISEVLNQGTSIVLRVTPTSGSAVSFVITKDGLSINDAKVLAEDDTIALIERVFAALIGETPTGITEEQMLIAIASAINPLAQRLAELEGAGFVTFDDVRDVLEPISEKASAALSQALANVDDIAQLKTDVAANSTIIVALQGSISSLQAEATAKWETLNRLENSVNALTPRVVTLENRAAALESRADELETTRPTYTAMNTAINNATANLATKTALAATDADLGALTTRTTALEDSLGDIDAALSAFLRV